MAGSTADAGLNAMKTARDTASDLTDRAGRTLVQTVEQNPLLVAGVGLVVGGLIASALPRTAVEEDLVGNANNSLKKAAAAVAASQGIEAVKNIVSEVYDKAARQAEAEGLTPDALGRAAQDIGQRVRRVAESAVTTAFEPQDQLQQIPTERAIMADQTFRTNDKSGMPSTPGSMGNAGSAPYGFEKAAGASKGMGDQAKGMTDQAKNAADQALAAGRDFKDKAMGAAEASAEALKNRASGLMDSAKDMAAQAVDSQKNAGAEYVGSLADTLRRAAREFDRDLPIAGSYIRKAASQVENVSDSIKNGSFDDLVRQAQSFARRQPTAFLGIAVLAGFGAVRFLRSSAGGFDTGSSGQNGSGGYTGGQGRQSYADNKGYRDEFSK